MSEKYTSLGLMSGTSGDGVDASLINSTTLVDFFIIQEFFIIIPNLFRQERQYSKSTLRNLW